MFATHALAVSAIASRFWVFWNAGFLLDAHAVSIAAFHFPVDAPMIPVTKSFAGFNAIPARGNAPEMAAPVVMSPRSAPGTIAVPTAHTPIAFPIGEVAALATFPAHGTLLMIPEAFCTTSVHFNAFEPILKSHHTGRPTSDTNFDAPLMVSPSIPA